MEFFRTVLCSSILLASTIASWAQTDGGPLAYPKAKTVDQVDDYHGTKVADPYRWLEDADSPDTKAWVQEEDKLTFGYLEKIPYRGAIRDRLLKLWNYERFTTPEQENGRYFFQHNNGLQNQNVLLVAESPNSEPRGVLGPNKPLSRGAVAFGGASVSGGREVVADWDGPFGMGFEEGRVVRMWE